MKLEHLLDHLRLEGYVLNSVNGRPHISPAGYPLSSQGYQLLDQYLHQPDKPDATVIDQIEAIARVFPNAVAVKYGHQEISYQELVAQLKAVATALSYQGVEQGDVVAVSMLKSAAVIPVLLGVMRAGAIYLPVDINLPEERRQLLIEDSGATAVIVHDEAATNQPIYRHIMQMPADRLINCALPDLPESASLGDIAYIIYTSGSTGKPKGVQISHASLAHHIAVVSEFYRMAETHRVLLFHSFSFDPSLEEIFSALVNGALLLLADDDELHNAQLINLLIDEQITHADIPPKLVESLFTDLLDNEDLIAQFALEIMIIGGEAPNLQFCRRWVKSALGKKCRLLNAYGPTEATVAATHHVVTENDTATIPIGKPLLGTRAYVVDQDGNLLGKNMSGELIIVGDRVADGYLNRKALNEQKFTTAYGTEEQVGYRTGDLVHWDEDWNLIFEGRIDQQVKIRGFRIELGEIATLAEDYQGVKSAAVVDRELAGSTQLVAFVSVEKDAIDISALMAYLSGHLPEYMLPAAIEIIDELPLNINGKTDLIKLRAYPLTSVEVPSKFPGKAPDQTNLTETQTAVATIWKDLLKLSDIRLSHHFFEVGGQSIQAIKMLALVNERFGRQIKLSAFRKNPTVEALSTLIDATKGAGNEVFLEEMGEGEVSATPAQRSLWFLSRLGLDASYYITEFWKVSWELDKPALLRAIALLVSRHDSLRATFMEKEGVPYMKVGDETAPFIKDIDQPLTVDEYPAAKAAFATAPFDLENGPLIRFVVINLGDEYEIGIAVHHIVFDGWSLDVLVKDLLNCYEYAMTGEKGHALKAPAQFRSFCAWQHQYEQSVAFAEHLDFWKGQLQDSEKLSLETDFKKQHNAQVTGSLERLSLTEQQTDLLQRLSKRWQTTPFSLFLTLVYALLHRYSRRSDICVGVPVANRSAYEHQEVIGYFVNSIALRINPSEEVNTFEDLVQWVSQTLTTAQEHEQVPIEAVITARGGNRSATSNPLYDIQVNYIPANHELTGTDQYPLMRQGYRGETAKFDLTFELEELAADEVNFLIEYKTTLFEQETIKDMLQNMAHLLELVDRESSRAMDTLNFTASPAVEEITRHIVSAVAYPDSTMHQLITEQVAKTPNHIALIDGANQITFQALEERAHQLAKALYGKFGEQRVVAIAMERSSEMVQAMVAVLKTGAAYLLIDPELPAERNQYMLRNSGVKVLLFHHRTAKAANGLAPDGVDSLAIENLSETNGHFSLKIPTGDDPAYMIYTSGSSGQPKGVEISHRAIVNHMLWMKEQFQWQEGEVFIQKTPVIFDASVWEFFLPLITGFPMVLSQSGAKVDTNVLLEELKKHEVTVLQGTPTLLDFLTKSPAFKSLNRLRRVFAGGEALHRPLGSLLATQYSLEVINLYGPTECTIDATWHRYDPTEGFDIVPIGKPIANMRPHILNTTGLPMPIGVPGELCFSGGGIANGYVNQPALTASSFLKYPQSGDQGLYRTGDLAKLDRHGVLHYLGRIDQQLKIRGVRIEAGEIENAIQACDEVSQVVVVLNKSNILVAYFVAADDIAEEALRIKVSERLPEFVVPSRFIQLDELPLTASGKLDRKSLVSREVVAGAGQYVPPASETEEKLTAIWLQIMQLEQVGVLDNFFALGGHSLIAMQILSRVNEEFGLKVTLKDFFNALNIRSLSAYLDELSIYAEKEAYVDIVSEFGDEGEDVII